MTIVVTIEIADDKREAFLAEIRATVDRVVAPLPGFISASFHRRLDAAGAMNYAQWATGADYMAFTQNEAVRSELFPIFDKYEAKSVFARFEVLGTHVPK